MEDEDIDNSGPCDRCRRHIPFADDFRCPHCEGCDECCDCEPEEA